MSLFELFIYSAIPFTEQRVTIPLGIVYYGYDPLLVTLVCFVGALLPAPFILIFFRKAFKIAEKISFLKPLMGFIDRKIRKRTGKFELYKEIALISFIGIPLPGTGVWTGSAIAAFLGLDFKKSMLCAAAGNLLSAIILLSLSLFASGTVLKPESTGPVITGTVLQSATTQETDNNQHFSSNTSGNISNGGLVCEYEGFIYYRSEASNWRLCEMNLQNNEFRVVTDDIASYINVADGWIYYSNFSDGHKLYRIKTDGTERQKLTDCMTTFVNVIGSTVYFINWDNFDESKVNVLSSVGIDGSGEKILNDMQFSSIVTDGEYLYAVIAEGRNEFSAFRIKTDGSEMLRLSEGQYAHFLCLTSTYVFCWDANSNYVFRCGKNGENLTAIGLKGVDYINADEEYVYYLNTSDRYNVYRMTHEGTDAEKLSDVKKDIADQPSFSPKNVHLSGTHLLYRAYISEDKGDGLVMIDLQTKETRILDN